LHAQWGPQGWWPARSRFEMMLGAILTQNTAWTNVERAIRNIREAGAMDLHTIHHMPLEKLAALIRPAGYYNLKAKRIRHFTRWLMTEFGGSINRMFKIETRELRARLLSVHGIGKETADSILLYAGHRPVFVVDAYTRRFLTRHEWADPRLEYDDVAALFDQHLRENNPRKRAALFNQYHALIVRLAKEHCRSKPDCSSCPLKTWLP